MVNHLDQLLRKPVLINKAKEISAELLELNLKNKLEELGKPRWEETGRNRKTGRKNTKNHKKLGDTERNRKKRMK